MIRNPLPLSGVRILDLTRLFPGPLASMMLGDLGAEVIKVEDPSVGDLTRHWPPFKANLGATFLAMNRSKRSLAINLKAPRGRELFLALAAKSDVVLESFRPGVMDRLGLGYEALKRSRANIILCSISGYGQSGPYRQRAGHDINYCARAGVLAVTGERGGPPMLPGVQVADVVGGSWQAMAAILGALYQREKTGEGQWLDVAMAEGALSTMLLMLSDLVIDESIPPRGEAAFVGGLPGYGIFETADHRYLAVGALEPHFFDALCEALALPQLKGKSSLMGKEGRTVKVELEKAFKSRSQDEWLEVFEKVDACVEPVLEPQEVLSDPQFVARNMFFKLPHPAAGTLTQIATPLWLSNRQEPHLPPPQLGEHTVEILESLGLDRGEIETLAAAGTIGIFVS